MKYQQAKSLLDLAAVMREGREENRAAAIRLLKEMKSLSLALNRGCSEIKYDESVVAPEFDLKAWEREHGTIAWLPGDSV